MKQKFTFIMDEKKNTITLQESAEADPGSFLTVHEEVYPYDEMKNAAVQGPDAFVEMVRRKNLFPPRDLTLKLFDTLKGIFEGEPADQVVMEYEDIEAFPQDEAQLADIEADDEDDDVDELEELLKDDDDQNDDISEDDIKEIDSDDDTPRFRTDDDSEHEN